MAKQKVATFSLSPETIDKINSISEEKNITKSMAIEIAISGMMSKPSRKLIIDRVVNVLSEETMLAFKAEDNTMFNSLNKIINFANKEFEKYNKK